MASSQRCCIAGLLLLVLICSHDGVEQVSSTGLCNLKVGHLKKCNSAILNAAQNPKNADLGNPSPDAPVDNPAEAPAADSPNEAPAADSPNEAPTTDSPAADSSAADNSAVAADAPAGEASADLTVVDDAEADADPGSDSSSAAQSECCQKAMEADIGCLCSFFSQRMVTILHVAENFINKLADMCNIKLNGCT